MSGKDISDGHHTFGELYEHRAALTVALCEALLVVKAMPSSPPISICKSWQHHPDDSPMFDRMFIVVISLPSGQISYHYSPEYWDWFEHVQEVKHAPKYDGHTPKDTIDRLIDFTLA